ncbi:MAG: hypothetical protein CMJ81_08065 [Planctomycetaceae bacterium]|nr:hypothetical protein [Planctomycetaceae bacterium]MBP62341.1 hypothetical protein [Planctomycetaceae bacterium]
MVGFGNCIPYRVFVASSVVGLLLGFVGCSAKDSPDNDSFQNSTVTDGKPVHIPAGKETVVQVRNEDSEKTDTENDVSGLFDELAFKKWPVPDFALFITGRQYGFIEPCGCTGLDNQKGGLSRRHSLLNDVRQLGWPVFPLDMGNQVRRTGIQAEIKYHMTMEALRELKYESIVYGPDDLRLTFEELLVEIYPDAEVSPLPYLSANVDLLDFIPRYQVKEVGGRRIGLTAVLGGSHHARVGGGEDILLTDPQESLDEVWPQLESEDCDLYVLLAHASIEESQELARRFKGFSIVITAGGAGEPNYLPEPIEGTESVLIQVGTKGMYAGVLGFYGESQPRLRYQRIALDAKWKDSPQMIRLLENYQHQLEGMGLKGLQLNPVAHWTGHEFVGTDQCGGCHEQPHEIWLETGHSHATATLVRPPERKEVPRHFDPECLSCHVTGWNFQGHLPYETGYVDLEASAHLHGNGCENCHGPGSAHVAAEQAEEVVDEDQLNKLREEMRLTLENAREFCMKCHDLDNSPDFGKEESFNRYWEEIAH